MSQIPNSRVLQKVFHSVWGLPEGNLRELIEIAARHKSDETLAKSRREARQAQIEATTGFGYMGGSSGVYMNADGIALMPISGPLVKHANYFDAVSGASSMEMMTDDLRMLLANADVKGILIDADSPGGQVAGIEEFSEILYAARGNKPVDMYVSGMCCSAMLWAGSGARKIWAGNSTLMGSVGVRATFIDSKKMEADMGIEEITILSSNASKKNPDPATPEGAEQIQATLDDLESVFLSNLSRNYGKSVEEIIDTFGQGDIMTGERAFQVGMIHEIGFREQALAGLTDSVSKPTANSSGASAKTRFKMNNETNPEAGASPTPTEQVATAAANAGYQVPQNIRERIAASYVGTRAVEDRLDLAAREHLSSLHVACQAAGLDGQLEAFVSTLKPTSLTQDVIPAATAQGSRVAVDTPNGQVAVKPVDAAGAEASTEPTATGKAALDNYMKNRDSKG